MDNYSALCVKLCALCGKKQRIKMNIIKRIMNSNRKKIFITNWSDCNVGYVG